MGMIGHSLGGQETLFTTAADTRIRAAVSSCGFGSLRMLKRDRILHNFALFVPGLAAARRLRRRARPGRAAAVPGGRAHATTRSSRGRDRGDGGGGAPAYRARRAADRLGTFYEQGPHEFSPAMREAAYAWLDRWLGRRLTRRAVRAPVPRTTRSSCPARPPGSRICSRWCRRCFT